MDAKNNLEDIDNQTAEIAQLWRSAVNSRLFFNTTEEAEFLLRKKTKKMSEIKDSTEICDIYHRFNQMCLSEYDVEFEYLLNAYKDASEIYDSSDFWGSRKQPSKQSFALKLFIKRFVQKSPIINETVNAISNRNDDDQLFAKFYSRDIDYENIDICFSVLLAWKIIDVYKEKPINIRCRTKICSLNFLKS